jgi:hypothetical protein
MNLRRTSSSFWIVSFMIGKRMLLSRGVTKLVCAALAGGALMAGTCRTLAQEKASSAAEIAPYSYSERVAYAVRPDYLIDREETVEYRIGTQAAAEELAQQRVPVNEHFNELQIVEAVTLKADGRRLPVHVDKIMTKASGDDGEALFEADETIRIIIFPDVAPGDRIRYVVRYRAKKPWLPGGFEIGVMTAPSHRYSALVISLDAPAAMKLHRAAKGFEHKEKRGAKRVIHQWTLAPLPYRPSETGSGVAGGQRALPAGFVFPEPGSGGSRLLRPGRAHVGGHARHRPVCG